MSNDRLYGGKKVGIFLVEGSSALYWRIDGNDLQWNASIYWGGGILYTSIPAFSVGDKWQQLSQARPNAAICTANHRNEIDLKWIGLIASTSNMVISVGTVGQNPWARTAYNGTL